ncbi:uncharacterized protein PGTG_14610 [Puccinia graminis f. sp. tritici CRL 75-36-700-3]|uniref:RING-type domain-containing protein n=1 Tax=Puccinia graminis f. sp. tritici (strain CRL 75-36-700-3 / race SCCL) TaxID=418459 RepID=E3KUC0_PUCGT|nr:uncharacterized protein PGTG_14610 [Puccinia graminis f. sp. tritici CRL 75-36-700-3]EFP87895.1 hypothetical protein PGTG_14610 [Puccinia graminis f. sp. tritici CRL 75-36-700-3]
MESSQEPAQIIEMQRLEAANDFHDCSPSSPSCYASRSEPKESPSPSDSSGVTHSSQAPEHLSNQQEPQEIKITIDHQGKREEDSKSPKESISDIQTTAPEHESISIIPPERSIAAQNSRPDSCAICMNSDESKDARVKLDCHHGFHSECIGLWILKNNYKSNCPTCRQPISLKTAMRITGCTSLVSVTKARVVLSL